MVRPEGDRSAALPPSRGTLVVASLTLVLVTADILLGGPLSRFDHWSAPWLLANVDLRKLHHLGQHQKSELVLLFLTEFGGRSVFLLVVPYLAVVSVRRRTIRPLARLAVLGVLVAAAVVGTKIGIGRTQPVHDHFWTAGGRSYPSGHSTTATIVWGLVAWTAVEHGSSAVLRRVTRVLRWFAPSATAAAMFLLAYHWFTDVVAGVALGVLLLWVLHAIDRTALAHLPGAGRGMVAVGGGGAARDRLDAGRVGARDGARRRALHDPRPADT